MRWAKTTTTSGKKTTKKQSWQIIMIGQQHRRSQRTCLFFIFFLFYGGKISTASDTSYVYQRQRPNYIFIAHWAAAVHRHCLISFKHFSLRIVNQTKKIYSRKVWHQFPLDSIDNIHRQLNKSNIWKLWIRLPTHKIYSVGQLQSSLFSVSFFRFFFLRLFPWIPDCVHSIIILTNETIMGSSVFAFLFFLTQWLCCFVSQFFFFVFIVCNILCERDKKKTKINEQKRP